MPSRWHPPDWRCRCLTVAALLALSSIPTAGRPGPSPRVVTTLLPVSCFALNVAGTLAQVENLLPPAAGPHDYQFSPRDLRKLRGADLIILNGLKLDDWLAKALQENVLQKTPPVIEAAAGLESGLIYFDQSRASRKPAEPNPHFWLDPLLASHAVTNILRALQKADPSRSAGYAENAGHFLTRLAQLDQEISARLEPFKGRPVVTSHNAFPYFFRRYQLTLAAVVEEWPDTDPTPKRLKQVADIIRQKKIRVLFSEPGGSSKLVKQLASDLGIQVAELDPFEVGPLTPGAYEEVMRRNAASLESHLSK